LIPSLYEDYICGQGVLLRLEWRPQVFQSPLLLKEFLHIGNSAFSDCRSLTELALPDSITTLGGSLFTYCSKLKEVKIPKSLAKADYSFRNSSVGSVIVPEGMTKLPANIFFESFVQIRLPTTVPTAVGSVRRRFFDEPTVMAAR
jgi:hypothetical protein